MVISFCLPSLYSGGAEKAMVNIAEGLSTRGYDIEMFILKEEGDLLSQSGDIDVKFADGYYNKYLGAASYIYDISRYFEVAEPDLFISSMSHLNVVAQLAKKMTASSTSVILTEHNTLSKKGGMKSWFVKRLVNILYNDAESIVAVSEGVADDLINTTRITSDIVNTIYNPVISEEIIKKSYEPIDNAWLHNEDIPVYLSAGRMVPQKNFPNLIKSFSIARESCDARLIIIGRGDHEDKLGVLANNEGVNEYIDFAGFVDNPYNYMRNASVFVSSSSWEGLPTVHIEAMACGCPIVSTNCPSGPFEILQGGKLGTLVPVDDPKSLAKGMIWELNNPTSSELLITSAKNRFSVKQSVDSYENLIVSYMGA